MQNQDSETKSRRARIEAIRQAHGPERSRGAAGILLYFEDFELKPDKEFGRKLKFCSGL
jgi:hypothetical protein